MRTLYIDATMGVAGDMLAGALLDLLDEPKRQEALERINAAGLEGVEVVAEKGRSRGVTGTHMRVKVGAEGVEEGAGHEEHHHGHHGHEHGGHEGHHHGHGDHLHDHHNGRHGMSLQEILDKVDELKVSESVKGHVVAVYQAIAAAESQVHGVPVGQIHFHEVGMLDAIADIMSAAILLEELAVDRIIASPITTGYGTVECAHGILPVPAPATALLLKGLPSYAGDVEGELCTPTGAALLGHFAQEFGRQPMLRTEAVGYGLGTKDFGQQVNALRVMVGETLEGEADEVGLGRTFETGLGRTFELGEANADGIVELSCNLDDMTGEDLGFATERLLEAGAKDVYLTPIYMKKNRPGHLLSVLCAPEDEERLAELIFRHTTTIGIRRAAFSRRVLKRREEVVETELGCVRVKVSEGYGVTRVKPEYEDLRVLVES